MAKKVRSSRGGIIVHLLGLSSSSSFLLVQSLSLSSLLLLLLLCCCCNSQVIQYKLNQARCIEYTKKATYDCRWAAATINGAIDSYILSGKIISYKIQWYTGGGGGGGGGVGWSNWYVPGYNDIDTKLNPPPQEAETLINCTIPYENNSMRRMWSYFYDHTHLYILCDTPIIEPTSTTATIITTPRSTSSQNQNSFVPVEEEEEDEAVPAHALTLKLSLVQLYEIFVVIVIFCYFLQKTRIPSYPAAPSPPPPPPPPTTTTTTTTKYNPRGTMYLKSKHTSNSSASSCTNNNNNNIGSKHW